MPKDASNTASSHAPVFQVFLKVTTEADLEILNTGIYSMIKSPKAKVVVKSLPYFNTTNLAANSSIPLTTYNIQYSSGHSNHVLPVSTSCYPLSLP